MKEIIIILLSLLMLFMGLNLKISNFRDILKSPKILILGLILQYSLMPLLAFLISIVFSLPPEYMIGMLLVGATSGGLASNVVCYLAKANLTLSILLTSSSTFLSAFLTPFIIKLYLGKTVYVSTYAILLTLLKIIIIPILIGIILNFFFERKLLIIKKIMPNISKITIIHHTLRL